MRHDLKRSPLNVIHRPSPNFNARPIGTKINSIIIHYTAKTSVKEAIETLISPESGVSAHFTICRKGMIYQHVSTMKRAWHAGKSSFRCLQDFNNFSIGIELYNPGHNRGYIPYTDAQIKVLPRLIKQLYTHHPIDPRLVLGHSDIAPDRKQDPGELFPWDRLVASGLAVRPKSVKGVLQSVWTRPEKKQKQILTPLAWAA